MRNLQVSTIPLKFPPKVVRDAYASRSVLLQDHTQKSRMSRLTFAKFLLCQVGIRGLERT